MVKTVPQIKPEFEKPALPAGKYNGRIIEFLEPKRSRHREELWMLGMKVEIKFQEETYHGFYYVNGYPNALIMIYRSRHVWLNKELPFKVTYKKSPLDDRMYADYELMLTDGWAEDKW